jgi:hypothetical protein
MTIVASVISFSSYGYGTVAPLPSASNSWEIEYARYLAEKESFGDPASLSPPEMLPAEDTWEAQYAAYCAEKEAKLNAKEQQQAYQNFNPEEEAKSD